MTDERIRRMLSAPARLFGDDFLDEKSPRSNAGPCPRRSLCSHALPLGLLDPILRSPHLGGAINVENAIQVIDLMLQDARQPSRGFQALRLSVPVLCLHRYRFMAFYFSDIPGYGEASLLIDE